MKFHNAVVDESPRASDQDQIVRMNLFTVLFAGCFTVILAPTLWLAYRWLGG